MVVLVARQYVARIGPKGGPRSKGIRAMMSHFTYLVTVEQKADQRRAAAADHLAAASTTSAHHEQTVITPSQRRGTRSFLGLRNRPEIA
jgi:hypothetical protein